jgi:hypothetical protein
MSVSPSDEMHLPTIPNVPTIPTATTYITAYQYIELASTPAVPAVHLNFDLSTPLSYVFFGLLVVFLVIYITPMIDSIIK